MAKCESSGDPTVIAVHAGVTYFGKWQANADFVRTYAHVNPWRFVSHGRWMLPEAAQDLMAYRGYLARGWEPWACRKVLR